MARYPTFEEYAEKRNWKEGIKRCNDLLKKHPKDIQILAVKLRLLCADRQDGKAVLDQLLATEPPMDLSDLLAIDAAVTESHRNVWPRPRTVGPEVTKLWDATVKASKTIDYKLELLVQRFECAIESNYMIDAQSALIQLKALQQRNRTIYMAHAAVTQLTSTSKGDLQARLALGLAKKAVSEKFDGEEGLDVRVVGQILALQGEKGEVEKVNGTRFAESKQVCECLKDIKKEGANGDVPTQAPKDKPNSTPAEGLAAEIEGLKAQFLQLIDSSANLETIQSFAATSTRLFTTSLTTHPTARPRTTATAAFLAISALIKSHQLSNQPHPLLLAAHLAEQVLQLDPHIHEARLILLYLYHALNLGTLAVHYFDSLSIKEVQFDTVGHALFTDLSYIFPHQLPFGKKEECNPLSRAKQAVQVYRRCEDKLAEAEAGVLRNGQTGMLFDLHELREQLQRSYTKRVIFLEVRRQARLLMRDSSWHTRDLGAAKVGNWVETIDNRDFAGTFDYGFGVERVLHETDGALPGKEWVLRALAIDAAWCLASGKHEDCPVEDVDALIAALEEELPDMSRLSISPTGKGAFPGDNFEQLAASLACQVLKLSRAVVSTPSTNEMEARIAGLYEAVRNLPVEALCGIATYDTLAEHLREHYLYVDILQTTAKACDLALPQKLSPESEGKLKQAKQRCDNGVVTLKRRAETARQRVSANDMMEEMKQSKDVYEALTERGGQGMDGFCATVAAAAKEGWAGLGKVKA